MIVEIKINGQKASGRTRTRVKQTGPLFEIIDPKIQNPSRTDEVLLRSKKTGWFGWLPKNEIIIKEWKSSND